MSIYSIDACQLCCGDNFSIKTHFTKPTRPNWQRKCDVRLRSLAVNLVFFQQYIFFSGWRELKKFLLCVARERKCRKDRSRKRGVRKVEHRSSRIKMLCYVVVWYCMGRLHGPLIFDDKTEPAVSLRAKHLCLKLLSAVGAVAQFHRPQLCV